MNKRFLRVLKTALVVSLVLAVVLPITVGAEKVSYDASSVHSVTRQELADFMVGNPVHNKTYDWLRYNCINFAVDLWHDAHLEGFDAFIIVINKGLLSHALVGFYADNGMCFIIDPQTLPCDTHWHNDTPTTDVRIEAIKIRDYYDATGVIGSIYGNDALRLYEAKHGGSAIPLIKEIIVIGKYKLRNLLR